MIFALILDAKNLVHSNGEWKKGSWNWHSPLLEKFFNQLSQMCMLMPEIALKKSLTSFCLTSLNKDKSMSAYLYIGLNRNAKEVLTKRIWEMKLTNSPKKTVRGFVNILRTQFRCFEDFRQFDCRHVWKRKTSWKIVECLSSFILIKSIKCCLTGCLI